MSEVKWIKLSTTMFEDEKIRLIESMPEADTLLIIWVKLLAQAGKTNAGGYIFLSEKIPYTDEMLATIFNRPLNIVRLALQTFQQFGMIEVNDEKFITITNWEKHQNIEGLDKIREQTKKRVAQYRERKRKQLPSPLEPKNEGNVTGNATVTQSNETDIDIDIEEEQDKKNSKSSRHKYNTCDMEHAELLFNLMLENNPAAKKPNLEKWAHEFRLLRERDNRTAEQIQFLIKWTQQDEFWKANILSPGKLRKQWDQLVIKVKREYEKGGKGNGQIHKSSGSYGRSSKEGYDKLPQPTTQWRNLTEEERMESDKQYEDNLEWLGSES